MTKKQAVDFVRTHNDNSQMDPFELDQVFAALYDREPDDQDREEGLWSHVCAAVEQETP